MKGLMLIAGFMCACCSAGRPVEARWSTCPARRSRRTQPVIDTDRQARRRQHSEERADGSHLRAAYQQGETVVQV